MTAISLGEPSAGFDPGIPEWGNPTRQNLVTPGPIHKPGEGTERTETSQYLQEEKSFP